LIQNADKTDKFTSAHNFEEQHFLSSVTNQIFSEEYQDYISNSNIEIDTSFDQVIELKLIKKGAKKENLSGEEIPKKETFKFFNPPEGEQDVKESSKEGENTARSNHPGPFKKKSDPSQAVETEVKRQGSRGENRLNQMIFDLRLSDNDFMSFVLDKMQKMDRDLSYKEFKSFFLPQHRKPYFKEWVRFRKLEKLILGHNKSSESLRKRA
jgi:hypothetical protein